MRTGIDWDDLCLVLALARGEGLSDAARSLGLNHGTHNDLRNVARVRATMFALADAIARNQLLLSGKPVRQASGAKRR